jgi:hypothetical protein
MPGCKDIRMLGIRSWWVTALNRRQQRELQKETKTLYEV